MSDAVVVALITVVAGGLITGLFKLVDRKAEHAKEEVSRNSAAVEAANVALEGMQVLATNLRQDYDREHEARVKLEHDLIEEKALNVALTKEVERLRKLGA